MPANSYNSLCDDFYVDMHVNTELELPRSRDTVLSFFEQIQKRYPTMGCFHRRRRNEFWLEEDHREDQYRWVNLEPNRVGSGVVNPTAFEEAYAQHRLVLGLIPYMLGVNHLDIDSLDITFAMDFDYLGGHDEVIAESLLGESAFGRLLDIPGSRAIGFSPVTIISLSDDDCTQARVSVESKTSVFEPRKKGRNNTDTAISLALTVRQYPLTEGKFDSLASFDHQCCLVEELMAERIMPMFVQPLVDTIARKRSTWVREGRSDGD